uniref:non-specific serine/threonine protein kinase n=2 Tax=Oryza brachyantha TaxID=4533 RepID=J3MBT2_ORYBR
MKLDSLDLRSNSINGRLPLDICNMENLEELYLNDNFLFGESPPCIGNLTSLRILDLSNNLLTLRFPFLSFANLKSLTKLSLSKNNLEGVLSLSSFSNNSQLKSLDLSGNSKRFHVQTESPITNLSAQLHVLVLPNCHLNGKSSIVPSFLLYQHALRIIDISNNNLRGYFPSWLIENNINLSFLYLRGNSFRGPLALPLKVHNTLLWLDASCNRLRNLPMDINSTFPNLFHLNLSRNNFHGFYPSAFRYMSSLSLLDFSYNNITDNIGAALVGAMSHISVLILSGNSFYGSFPRHLILPFINHLVLNDNNITGNIPENFCQSLQLTVLDVSSNKLTGSLPNCLFELSDLAVLNLRENYLVGSIPSGFCHLIQLVFLDVSRNNLSGPLQCLPNLQYLHLSENRLNGTFPIPLPSGTDTCTIDLRGNQFSGIIPSVISKAFTGLKVLLLGGNMFEGVIPNDVCHLRNLRLLDLSSNKFSGKIPSCLSRMGLDDDLNYFEYTDENSTSLVTKYFPGEDDVFDASEGIDFVYELDQEVFTTKSRQGYYMGNILNYMSGLDFSSNQLEGNIPENIGRMQWLRALNLSNNLFSGPIPKSLSNLSNLESLDLSHNSLGGQIPPELQALQSLEVFSVAYNNLSGPTLGTKDQFITFGQSSYEGNPYLCGPPLQKSCSAMPTQSIPQHEQDDDGDDQAGDVVLICGSALFYVIGLWTSLAVLYFKRTWRDALFLAVDRFSDLLMVRLSILSKRIGSTN